MSLLDKIADKARNTTGKLRGPAILFSSIADYVAGTYDEMTGHKMELGKHVLEDGGERDYQLYGDTIDASLAGQGVATVLAVEYCPSKAAVYALGADTVVRAVNVLASSAKRKFGAKKGKSGDIPRNEDNITGIIGTVRAIGCKLAGRLKRSKDETGATDEDPFDDADYPMPQAKPAADAEDEDPLASVEQDDTGNKLF